MVAVVAPHRHLPLRMVQRMQCPPPIEMMLAPVYPVVGEIKNDQVDDKAEHGAVRHAGPELVQVQGAEAAATQLAKQRLQRVLQGEEHHQFEQPQPVDQGIDHIDPNRPPIRHRLYWPQALRE